MPNPSPSAERFAELILWLSQAVVSRSLVGWLGKPQANLILDRLRGIKEIFARLAARIAAGRFLPRRSGPRRSIAKKPRRPDMLPKKPGWLIPLVPEAAAFACQLRSLLVDPEMAALVAAAPASMRRPLRSICRMLGVETPPVLALPPRIRVRAAPRERPPRPPPARMQRPSRVRYVFGLRYPPPFPDPA